MLGVMSLLQAHSWRKTRRESRIIYTDKKTIYTVKWYV